MRNFNPQNPVWNGPMTGQTVGRCWVETQNGEFRVMGGEGNPATGVFVYELRKTGRFTDAVGTADNNIGMIYQSPFFHAGAPSREKYLRAIHYDLQLTTGTPTADVYDLDGVVQQGLAITPVT
jgi:hypothetical protein